MILNKNILDIRRGTQVKYFLKLSRKYPSILCYEVVLAPSLGFKLNPFVPPCVSVSLIQSLDKFDLRVFCRTCSWIQSVLRSHRTSNTLKHLDSPLQGETFLIDRRINILHSRETYIVPSCLPTMLSEVVGESLPYLGKLTKTWIACHSHTGGIQFNSIQFNSILFFSFFFHIFIPLLTTNYSAIIWCQ